MEFRLFICAATFLFALIGCGGGGGGGSSEEDDSVDPVVLAAVSALFPVNGADWNDYVIGDEISTAVDLACDPGGVARCQHGGEVRVVAVTGRSSCSLLTAKDELRAFDWSCDDSTNPVRMVSSRLSNDMHLSNLVDFDLAAFKPNKLNIFENGVLAFTTPETIWWANAVEVDNDGGSLATESTVYLVTANAAAAYSIDASRVSLVVEPGVTLSGSAAGSGADTEVIASLFSANRLWIEGEVDATGDDRGIQLSSPRFVRVRNLSVRNAFLEGIFVSGGRNIFMQYLTAIDNGTYGIRVSGSIGANPNFTLEDSHVSGNDTAGLQVRSTDNNQISRLTASRNGISGDSGNIHLENADGNRFSDIKVSKSPRYGIWFENSLNNRFDRFSNNNNEIAMQLDANSGGNIFANVVSTNNDNGIVVNSPDNFFANTITGNTLTGNAIEVVDFTAFVNLVVTNNTTGILLTGDDNLFSGTAVIDHNAGDIILTNSSDNVFTGPLLVGPFVAPGLCRVSGGTNPGLIDLTCQNNGGSDADLSTDVTLATSFVGNINSDDRANTSDTNGSATELEALAADFDWVNFDNQFRAWNRSSNSFDNRGSWPVFFGEGDGLIRDWSLSTLDIGNAGNPALLDVLALPADGNDTISVLRSGGAAQTQTALRHAVELFDDGIGDDDGLCESNETCLYTPNLGAYQGHGNLISAGAFVDGVLSGITLLRYQSNGR